MPANTLRARFRVTAALLTVACIALTGCGATANPNTGPTAGPATKFERGVVVPGSGNGMKIGYISLGDSIPFVKLVSDDIKKQAEIAGAQLVFCDSQLDAAKALACAANFKAQGVQGIINFQVDEKAAERVCAAGPDVPVVAVDIHQRPCEKTFMGADNYNGGRLAGESLGKYFKANFDCQFDALVSLEAPASGEATIARANGGKEGFAAICGAIPTEKLKAVDGGISIDKGRSVFADALTSLPAAKRIAVISLNDDMLLGAYAAAKSMNRQAQVFGAAMGADPTSWNEIRTNPNWVGDAAWFPEKYGTVAVPAIIALISGQEVPKELLTEHIFIDKSNIAAFYK